MCAKYNGKLTSMLANVDYIIHSIISNSSISVNYSYNKMLQEHDMEIYAEQQVAETKITRKPLDSGMSGSQKELLNFQVVPQRARVEEPIVVEKVQSQPAVTSQMEIESEPIPIAIGVPAKFSPLVVLAPVTPPTPPISPVAATPPISSNFIPLPPPQVTPQSLFCLDIISSHLKFIQS